MYILCMNVSMCVECVCVRVLVYMVYRCGSFCYIIWMIFMYICSHINVNKQRGEIILYISATRDHTNYVLTIPCGHFGSIKPNLLSFA